VIGLERGESKLVSFNALLMMKSAIYSLIHFASVGTALVALTMPASAQTVTGSGSTISTPGFSNSAGFGNVSPGTTSTGIPLSPFGSSTAGTVNGIPQSNFGTIVTPGTNATSTLGVPNPALGAPPTTGAIGTAGVSNPSVSNSTGTFPGVQTGTVQPGTTTTTGFPSTTGVLGTNGFPANTAPLGPTNNSTFSSPSFNAPAFGTPAGAAPFGTQGVGTQGTQSTGIQGTGAPGFGVQQGVGAQGVGTQGIGTGLNTQGAGTGVNTQTFGTPGLTAPGVNSTIDALGNPVNSESEVNRGLNSSGVVEQTNTGSISPGVSPGVQAPLTGVTNSTTFQQ
jgi:hypothetical protein